MDMVTKIISIYKETRAFLTARWDFILHRFWQVLSILSIFYFAMSGLLTLLASFNLVDKDWGGMMVEFLKDISILLLLLIIIMFALSTFRRGRKSFDRIIKYREFNLDKRLANIETRLDNIESRLSVIETRLDDLEARVEKIENKLHMKNVVKGMGKRRKK
ncbi:MAG: hypothetical protein WCD72_08340 [Dehalococcoidia bacterium]